MWAVIMEVLERRVFWINIWWILKNTFLPLIKRTTRLITNIFVAIFFSTVFFLLVSTVCTFVKWTISFRGLIYGGEIMKGLFDVWMASDLYCLVLEYSSSLCLLEKVLSIIGVLDDGLGCLCCFSCCLSIL